MSIRTSFDPMGTLGGEQWHNWSSAAWASTGGATVYSSEYIISDFIPVSPGTVRCAGVGVVLSSTQTPGVIAYNASRQRIDYWNLSVDQTQARNVSKADMAYVRIQTTRALYKESYVMQNGVYLFKGEDNPPKPL